MPLRTAKLSYATVPFANTVTSAATAAAEVPSVAVVAVAAVGVVAVVASAPVAVGAVDAMMMCEGESVDGDATCKHEKHGLQIAVNMKNTKSENTHFSQTLPYCHGIISRSSSAY